ncbi:glycosyltransferase [bacterium (Candidatus Blackallbacteria) CG17_big_fil_post_rev_8_21_14_2_50_48_46]|uniref:Glycosyltransferase n=1 Tax=bacterium (Candidatus Blackallbacteria) CG17_big_fil_post_rev_8_21_14_2_50_48_46 TaxID=2014261 RepID=A0A2M7FYE6_9BACT|nr:MAG: glycosyltransferase [bacterium (Candidatus Blackallbacteria) CG18_big_fil_WC_8_21_14_2_50_49_26]PIW14176.1 MAG: glycosyltransferase [bacterium (Candidatus Blackallbacteria) CG17_big_fil_post_rev_8_21_14_2_50_48_46]PIW46717.1 MAG: glycosyltransferase [bacterium (Candidatus Blackallbacteria) CG13_big_fil_rev_8_21_14_2_50_49_14]
MKTLNKNWPVTALLNISVDCIGKSALLELLQSGRSLNAPIHLVTMNAEMAYSALENPDFMRILQSADLIIPDGIGVVWALARQGVKVARLPGVEIVEDLLAASTQSDLKLALLGSSESTHAILPGILQERFGEVKLVYRRNGFFQPEDVPQLIAEINQAQPDILFVALGVPKQEEFIAKWRSELKVPILIGVGGSFDVISGQLQRAPLWMRKMHLEWFYRLIQQPSRWRRMLALPKFVLKVMFSPA